MLKEIIDTALLGTERKPFDLKIFPESIQEALKEVDLSNPENAFLDALAIYNNYLEAGRVPEVFNGDLPENPIEEVKDIAPGQVNNIFKEIEQLESPLKINLFRQWINSLHQADWIASPEIIVPLIQFSENLSNDIKLEVAGIIGNKGLSILPYMPGFSFKQKAGEKALWEEGTTAERKELLQNLMQTDPKKAINILKSTWEQESIVVKKSFLETCKENSSDHIVPFIEELIGNEFRYNKKEKKTETDCRRTCSEILLQNANSKLFASSVKKLKEYIYPAKKKGIFGMGSNKKNLEFNLPDDKGDSFWNAENISETYGFETKNYDFALFKTDVQYWFSLMLCHIPIKSWCKEYDIGQVQFIESLLHEEQFRVKEKGRETAIYMASIIENAHNHKDSELAYILAKINPHEIAVRLVRYMLPGFFENFIVDNNYTSDRAMLTNGPYVQGKEYWSISFSRKVLKKIVETLKSGTMHTVYGLGNEIGVLIHPEIYAELVLYDKKLDGSPSHNTWKKHIYLPLIKALDIRKTLMNSTSPN